MSQFSVTSNFLACLRERRTKPNGLEIRPLAKIHSTKRKMDLASYGHVNYQ
jgi:hypothetical protein